MKYVIAVLVIIGLAGIGSHAAAADGGFGLVVKPTFVTPYIVESNPFYSYYPPANPASAAFLAYRADAFMLGIGVEFGSYSGVQKLIRRDSAGAIDTSYTGTSYAYSTFFPEIAARVYFGGAQDGGIDPYIGLSGFYSIGMSDISYAGTKDTAAMRRLNEDLTGNLGGTLGIGIEYAFTPRFSIGGECGARLIASSLGHAVDSGWDSELSEVRASSYASLSLNYFFR